MLTRHIQEDAFISWRVAKNLVNHGVIGYNGSEPISSSTSHLYVFISALFYAALGENFFYLLIILNSFLVTLTLWWFSGFFYEKTDSKRLWLFAFLNLLPPVFKMSILGMEYALLFFLMVVFLSLLWKKRENRIVFLLPVLILWTRLDSIAFLGFIGLWWWYVTKKFPSSLLFSGLVGLLSVLSFNYLYFGEVINHTIVAKSVAYGEPKTFRDHLSIMIDQANFFNYIKIPGFGIHVFLLFTALSFLVLLKSKRHFNQETYSFLITLFLFAVVKSLAYGYMNSAFDWYYWLPQIFLFLPFPLWVIDKEKIIYRILFLLAVSVPLTLYQLAHSLATGNGEWNYSRNIGLYLGKIESDKNKVIFLEPAGYIPYFSGLKVMDWVGLVDRRVTEEIKKDRVHFLENCITKYQPDYLLTYEPVKNENPYSNYQLIKVFKISEVAKSDHPLLDKLFRIKPSGRDYYLYKRKS